MPAGRFQEGHQGSEDSSREREQGRQFRTVLYNYGAGQCAENCSRNAQPVVPPFPCIPGVEMGLGLMDTILFDTFSFLDEGAEEIRVCHVYLLRRSICLWH